MCKKYYIEPEASAKYHWDRATLEVTHASNRIGWASVLQLGLLAVALGGIGNAETSMAMRQLAWLGIFINTAAVVGYVAALGASENLMRSHDEAMKCLEEQRPDSERNKFSIVTTGRGGGRRLWHHLGTFSSFGMLAAYYYTWIWLLLEFMKHGAPAK